MTNRNDRGGRTALGMRHAGDATVRDLVDNLSDILGRDPIPRIDTIDTFVRMPTGKSTFPQTPAATPEDQLARDAVAAIEREDDFHACAESRLRGAYDGDTEHRIALKAIELFKQSTREDGLAKAAVSNHGR